MQMAEKLSGECPDTWRGAQHPARPVTNSGRAEHEPKLSDFGAEPRSDLWITTESSRGSSHGFTVLEGFRRGFALDRRVLGGFG